MTSDPWRSKSGPNIESITESRVQSMVQSGVQSPGSVLSPRRERAGSPCFEIHTWCRGSTKPGLWTRPWTGLWTRILITRGQRSHQITQQQSFDLDVMSSSSVCCKDNEILVSYPYPSLGTRLVPICHFCWGNNLSQSMGFLKPEECLWIEVKAPQQRVWH